MRSLFSALFQWLLSHLFHQTPPLSQEAAQASRAAVAETKLDVLTKASAAQAAVAKAVTDAPKDTAGVVAELQKGEF